MHQGDGSDRRVPMRAVPCLDGNEKGIRNLVWVLAPWVFVAITFKEWILVLDG